MLEKNISVTIEDIIQKDMLKILLEFESLKPGYIQENFIQNESDISKITNFFISVSNSSYNTIAIKNWWNMYLNQFDVTQENLKIILKETRREVFKEVFLNEKILNNPVLEPLIKEEIVNSIWMKKTYYAGGKNKFDDRQKDVITGILLLEQGLIETAKKYLKKEWENKEEIEKLIPTAALDNYAVLASNLNNCEIELQKENLLFNRLNKIVKNNYETKLKSEYYGIDSRDMEIRGYDFKAWLEKHVLENVQNYSEETLNLIADITIAMGDVKIFDTFRKKMKMKVSDPIIANLIITLVSTKVEMDEMKSAFYSSSKDFFTKSNLLEISQNGLSNGVNFLLMYNKNYRSFNSQLTAEKFRKYNDLVKECEIFTELLADFFERECYRNEIITKEAGSFVYSSDSVLSKMMREYIRNIENEDINFVEKKIEFFCDYSIKYNTETHMFESLKGLYEIIDKGEPYLEIAVNYLLNKEQRFYKQILLSLCINESLPNNYLEKVKNSIMENMDQPVVTGNEIKIHGKPEHVGVSLSKQDIELYDNVWNEMVMKLDLKKLEKPIKKSSSIKF